MDVRLVAGPTPRRIAAAYRRANLRIPADIRAGFQRALPPLHAAIEAQAYEKFPDRYAAEFVAGLHVEIKVGQRSGAITADARVFATGKVDRRKITDLNRGRLRHPVYGRRRRRLWTTTRPRRRIPGGQLIAAPWVSQPIAPGFADEAVAQTRPGIRREMQAVLAAVEQTLTGA